MLQGHFTARDMRNLGPPSPATGHLVRLHQHVWYGYMIRFGEPAAACGLTGRKDTAVISDDLARLPANAEIEGCFARTCSGGTVQSAMGH